MLPESLRLLLTWDQGPEMRDWNTSPSTPTPTSTSAIRTHPGQRGTNENTNGLLRQYFPKCSDLSLRSAEDLDWVAQELTEPQND